MPSGTISGGNSSTIAATSTESNAAPNTRTGSAALEKTIVWQ